MKLKGQLLEGFIISFVALLGFTMMAVLVRRNSIVSFDSLVISLVQGTENPFLTRIMTLFSIIGDVSSVIILSLITLFILYKVLHHRTELILFIAVIIGAATLFSSLKSFFQRARPDLHRLAEASNYSFPSGHATMACAFYGILAFLLWRHISSRQGRMLLITISVGFILAIGVSRIYLGVHYPSDIIAGYFISTFWLSLAIGIFQRYKHRQVSKGKG